MAQQEYNYLIDNGNLRGDESAVFFDGEPCTILPASTTMPDILVLAGVFPSKGQARKDPNWPNAVPMGWTDYQGIGRSKKRITILKPITPKAVG